MNNDPKHHCDVDEDGHWSTIGEDGYPDHDGSCDSCPCNNEEDDEDDTYDYLIGT